MNLNSISGALNWGVETLKTASIESPLRDARILLAHALSKPQSFLIGYPESTIGPHELSIFEAYIGERLKYKPVSRILGTREFWSLNFIISKDTLDPRPDTETLIETVLKHSQKTKESLKILDLGTGSGCILISLLHELKNAYGIGADISQGALDVAQENGLQNGVNERIQWIQSSWYANLSGTPPFDIITSNPPYIPESHRSRLAPDVLLYDPETALFGGVDGLECYRLILEGAPKFLTPKGHLFLEIGQGQEKDIIDLGAHFGLECIEIVPDLGGINRCLMFKCKEIQ